MRGLKLAVMVLTTTLLATALCWISMQITAYGRIEYVDYRTMPFYTGYLAFIHIAGIMAPLTLGLEPVSTKQRWPYFLIACTATVGWTILLDGPTQPISYVLAFLVGLACATMWSFMLIALKPWKQSNA